MDKYSPSEFISNCISFVRTRIFYSQCRFIRFPFFIRGRRSMCGARGLTLGRFCRFELDGTKATLHIGNNCEMGDMTHIVALNNVEIGDNVLIASKCFISDTSHGIYSGEQPDRPEVAPNRRRLHSSSVKIGNNVWIGENVVILPGTLIEDGCVIGANAVVGKQIPRGSIVVKDGQIIKKYNKDMMKWV